MESFEAGYVAGLDRATSWRWPMALMLGEVVCFAAGVLVGAGVIR
jgi:hypothetical protein